MRSLSNQHVYLMRRNLYNFKKNIELTDETKKVFCYEDGNGHNDSNGARACFGES